LVIAAVAPFPISPSLPYPQHWTPPAEVSAQVNEPAGTMDVMVTHAPSQQNWPAIEQSVSTEQPVPFTTQVAPLQW
jgi:hypothetical protein